MTPAATRIHPGSATSALQRPLDFAAVTDHAGKLGEKLVCYDPNADGVRLTGLLPETYYRVYLSAATAQGGGEHIFLDMKTTPAERKPRLFHT